MLLMENQKGDWCQILWTFKTNKKKKIHLPNNVNGDKSESLSMIPRQNTKEGVAGHKNSAPGRADLCY